MSYKNKYAVYELAKKDKMAKKKGRYRNDRKINHEEKQFKRQISQNHDCCNKT